MKWKCNACNKKYPCQFTFSRELDYVNPQYCPLGLNEFVDWQPAEPQKGGADERKTVR